MSYINPQAALCLREQKRTTEYTRHASAVPSHKKVAQKTVLREKRH